MNKQFTCFFVLFDIIYVFVIARPSRLFFFNYSDIRRRFPKLLRLVSNTHIILHILLQSSISSHLT